VLADDQTLLVDVIAHAIQWFQERGQVVSEVCCIFATAPFVTSKALRLGLDTLQTSRRNFALSITSFPFPVQRAVKVFADGSINAMYPEFRKTRSQDLEPAWHDAGQFCWGTCQAFTDRLPVFSEHTAGVVLPRHLVQDLDTLEDWRRAELMYEVLRQSGELP
jgi:N-acylneuraminate cytidylyltransferase